MLAYCGEPYPEQPIQATNVSTELLNEPGQEITYTCNQGFEFAGDPIPITLSTPTTTTTTTTTTVTTTISMEWKIFKGAQYAKGEDELTWEEARSKCQEAGGDLVTIHTWEVHNFIHDEWGDSFDAWIGLTDKETEGVYKWASGVQFEYNNWYPSCSAPQNDDNDNKDCVRWESFVDGRWDHADCAQEEKFFCEKGTSESEFWNLIRGAEYAHLERKSCYDVDWDESKAICEGYGGDLAMVLTQETFDEIVSNFDSGISEDFWFGLKRTSGTYKWTNGEEMVYTGWGNSLPNSDDDCVRIKQQNSGGWVWDDKSCSSSSVKGVLCMKGNPEGPNGWIFTQALSRDSRERYEAGTQLSNGGDSGAECCQKCGESNANTRNIAFGNNMKCWCITELNPSTCTSSSGSCKSTRYVSGPCTFISSKKKRQIIEIPSKETLLSAESSVAPSFQRYKRNTDDSVIRRITCEPIWDNTAGHWNYPYEVPKYCFSNSYTF